MTDKTEEKDEPDHGDEVYAAYLLARAGLEIRGRAGWTLGESYAAALGVHHFHRGTKPLSQRRLVARVDRACQVDAGEDLGPSPPDPGAREADAAWSRLYDFIVQNFPEERGKVGSVVDSAVRLLGELGGARALARESVTLARDAVLGERAACARFLRRWPNANAGVLAEQIAEGAHADLLGDPLGPSPPDPG